MSHFLFSNYSSLIFLIRYYFIGSLKVHKFSKCLLFYFTDIAIFLQWKRKGNYTYEQQLKYLHVLDIILLSNLHWFNSLGFKTSSTNLWKECRDFNWLYWSFCLLKDSRAGSKENKIKSYWISNNYIGQWKGTGTIVHWLKTFPDCDVHSHHNHITYLHLEKKPKVFFLEIQRRDSSLTCTNNSALFKKLRGLRRQAYT